MVNTQMVPMKNRNVSLTYRNLKKNKFRNGQIFDSVTDRH